MKVAALIDILKDMPMDAECFIGREESVQAVKYNEPVFSLYDFTSIRFSAILRSCRSGLPTSNHIKNNVVTFEYD